MNNILPVPHFQQSDEGYCLPACARMVLAYLGIQLTEAEISQVLGTQVWGTPSPAIRLLASLSLNVVYQAWSSAELDANIKANQPMIIFVRTGFMDYYQEDFAHAVVVVGLEQDQQFWVQDPQQPTGPNSLSWNGLLAAWSEFDYFGAVLHL